MRTRPLILIVDDDPVLRDLLALCLEDTSLEIITASDGLMAFVVLEERIPEVIILDVNMPGMNGWSFLNELEYRNLKRIPVILVSADTHLEEQTRRFNIVGFLPKPFDLQRLDALIHRALSTGR